AQPAFPRRRASDLERGGRERSDDRVDRVPRTVEEGYLVQHELEDVERRSAPDDQAVLETSQVGGQREAEQLVARGERKRTDRRIQVDPARERGREQLSKGDD